MGDPVTQAQFFQALQDLDAKNQERHARVRDALADGFRRLEEKLDAHAKEDHLVESRVTIIETQRAEEAKRALSHSTWAALFATTGLTATIEAVKHWWK